MLGTISYQIKFIVAAAKSDVTRTQSYIKLLSNKSGTKPNLPPPGYINLKQVCLLTSYWVAITGARAITEEIRRE